MDLLQFPRFSFMFSSCHGMPFIPACGLWLDSLTSPVGLEFHPVCGQQNYRSWTREHCCICQCAVFHLNDVINTRELGEPVMDFTTWVVVLDPLPAPISQRQS